MITDKWQWGVRTKVMIIMEFFIDLRVVSNTWHTNEQIYKVDNIADHSHNDNVIVPRLRYDPLGIRLTVIGLMTDPILERKSPIRARCLGHVAGYQPIRGQYFMVFSVPRQFNVFTFTCACSSSHLPWHSFWRLSQRGPWLTFLHVPNKIQWQKVQKHQCRLKPP